MNELMSDAIELAVAGVGFVFSFLVILVFATLLMSKLIVRFLPPEPATPAKAPRAKGNGSAKVDPDTAEAIKKAIAQYRSRHKK